MGLPNLSEVHVVARRLHLIRNRWRLAVALLVAGACVVTPALPAQADPPRHITNIPPAAGWSAEWHVSVPSDEPTGPVYFSMKMPHAALDGYSDDHDTTRDVTISLTDTSPESYLCVWLTVTGNDDYYYWVVCDGTAIVHFHDDTPSDYTFSFQLRNAENTWRQVSGMIVPNGSSYPELRSWPYEGSWEYITDTVVHYNLQRPGGIVDGYAFGYPARNVDMNITAGSCLNTLIYDYAGQVASKSTCGTPSTLATSLSGGFKITTCLTSRGAPPPGQIPTIGSKCVPLYVI
jgi:hypothetical protein